MQKLITTVETSLVVPKEQVRKDFSNIEGLAQSIVVSGQISPIIVSPADENGLYEIQKGERRWRACKSIGRTIDIIINLSSQTHVESLVGELVENIQRESLSMIEISNAIKELSDKGLKGEEIAQMLGKSKSYVSNHLSLIHLPKLVLELVECGVTKDVELLNNLRKLHSINARQAEDICLYALKNGITRKISQDLLKATKAVTVGVVINDKQSPVKSTSEKLEEEVPHDLPIHIKRPEVLVVDIESDRIGVLVTNECPFSEGFAFVVFFGASHRTEVLKENLVVQGIREKIV